MLGADAEEDVHGVAAGDVHDGGVSPLVLLRRRPGGEEVGHRGAQRDYRDGGDGVVDVQDAAQQLGEVADDDGEPGDVPQRPPEADPAAQVVCGGREDGEDHLPREPDDVEHPVHHVRVLLLLARAVAVERLRVRKAGRSVL